MCQAEKAHLERNKSHASGHRDYKTTFSMGNAEQGKRMMAQGGAGNKGTRAQSASTVEDQRWHKEAEGGSSHSFRRSQQLSQSNDDWRGKPEMTSWWGRGEDSMQKASDRLQQRKTKGAKQATMRCSSNAEDTGTRRKDIGVYKILL